MNKLLIMLGMVFAVSNAFAKEDATYSQDYVPTLDIPNLNSMPISMYDKVYSFNALINPSKILYMNGVGGKNTYLYFRGTQPLSNFLIIKGSVEDVLQEFSKNKCHERKPECTNKDSKYINLYKTPIFIPIEGARAYNGTLYININNIESIAYNYNIKSVEITLSTYTTIPTKQSVDELSALIYGATH